MKPVEYTLLHQLEWRPLMGQPTSSTRFTSAYFLNGWTVEITRPAQHEDRWICDAYDPRGALVDRQQLTAVYQVNIWLREIAEMPGE